MMHFVPLSVSITVTLETASSTLLVIPVIFYEHAHMLLDMSSGTALQQTSFSLTPAFTVPCAASAPS